MGTVEQNSTPLLDAVWAEMAGRLAVPLLMAVIVLLIGIFLLMKTRNRLVFGGLFSLSLLPVIIAFASFIGFDQTVRAAAKKMPKVKPERVDKVIDIADRQPYYGLIASIPAIVVSGIGLARKPKGERQR